MKELTERGEKWARRNGRSPYPVMDIDDICALPVQDMAAKDCALFLWTTHPKLEEGLRVMREWGFSFRTVAFTWVKLNKTGRGFKFGLGYWVRQNPEIVLLGTRGQPKRADKSVFNLMILEEELEHVVIRPVTDHSRKPNEVHKRIDRLMGPEVRKAELFARRPYGNWSIWGNEVDCSPDIVKVLGQPDRINQEPINMSNHWISK